MYVNWFHWILSEFTNPIEEDLKLAPSMDVLLQYFNNVFKVKC
jgi:hypothetical protein